eukprot:3937668-Rhodomonas_salina.1
MTTLQLFVASRPSVCLTVRQCNSNWKHPALSVMATRARHLRRMPRAQRSRRVVCEQDLGGERSVGQQDPRQAWCLLRLL